MGGAAVASGTKGAAPPVARLYDPNRKVEVVSYNMERFAQDCVTVFCELSGYEKAKVGTAPTPFLDEANDPLSVIADDGPLANARGQGGKEVEGAKLSKIACRS